MDARTESFPDLAPDLTGNAAAAAGLLRLMGNERRLVLLCHLVAEGEMGVGALAAAVGLSQPALSQHLALLRESGVVATRRESQAVFYRLADARAAAVLRLLRDLYCPADSAPPPHADIAAKGDMTC
jgi:ArsR family transcriptional regulator, virulence genes transcriptional regulator